MYLGCLGGLLLVWWTGTAVVRSLDGELFKVNCTLCHENGVHPFLFEDCTAVPPVQGVI